MKKVHVKSEYIELKNFLKITGIIQTGGEAKYYLIDNPVLVNGETENRRGRKLYPGDQVLIRNETYLIASDVD